jgi:hypothetical protein
MNIYIVFLRVVGESSYHAHVNVMLRDSLLKWVFNIGAGGGAQIITDLAMGRYFRLPPGSGMFATRKPTSLHNRKGSLGFGHLLGAL